MSPIDSEFKKAKIKVIDSSAFHGGVPRRDFFKTPSIVLVKANLCPHCVRYAPEFIKFKHHVGALDFYAMDADTNKAYLAKYGSKMGVKGYPTILKIVDGKIVRYDNDDRTMPNLIKFACSGGLC